MLDLAGNEVKQRDRLTPPPEAAKLRTPSMKRISFWHLAFGLSWAGLVVAAASCGDPFGQTATTENRVDTVTLYALRQTPIRLPSAYNLLEILPTRTDTSSAFDFAFDFDSLSRPAMYPAGALGLTRDPGIQLMQQSFEEVRRAPETGYLTDRPVPVKPGDVFVARSRVSSFLCLYVSLPRYGKFHVLAVDTTARSITLEGLVNVNCGFRDLQPGIPSS